MSTRSQRKLNTLQESNKNLNQSMVFPIVVKNEGLIVQAALIVSPSRAKSPRVEINTLDCLRSSMKEKISSETKKLLLNFKDNY